MDAGMEVKKINADIQKLEGIQRSTTAKLQQIESRLRTKEIEEEKVNAELVKIEREVTEMRIENAKLATQHSDLAQKLADASKRADIEKAKALEEKNKK